MKLNPFVKSNNNGKNLQELLFEEPNNNKTLHMDLGQWKNHEHIADFWGVKLSVSYNKLAA